MGACGEAGGRRGKEALLTSVCMRFTPTLQATDLGRIASQYYVSYRTIAAFNDHLKPTMGEIELLRLFALAEEFKYMVVREVSA